MMVSLVLLAAVGAVPPATCTVVVRPWVRFDSMAYIVATARADTVLAAYWVPSNVRFPRPGEPVAVPQPPLPPQPVYGQRVRVERASGVRSGREALLIFWRLGPMCDFQPRAESARGLPSGVRFFLAGAPRPDSLPQAGGPAFDVATGITLYAPDLERRQAPRSWRTLWRRPQVLSVAEYEELYRALPPSAAWYENAERSVPGRARTRAWRGGHQRGGYSRAWSSSCSGGVHLPGPRQWNQI